MRKSKLPLYQRMVVPHEFIGVEVTKVEPATDAAPTSTACERSFDSLIYFSSIFLREFVSTICLLILNSRLGGDLFIAGPVVTLYVNIVFRRPLNNPFVSTLACMSSGEWKHANVAGYPGFNKEKTHWWELLLFWMLLLAAQLGAAATAAEVRAYNDRILGYEFIKGAAWGTGQMHMRANLEKSDTCWEQNYFSNGTKADIPIRLYRNDADKLFKDDACRGDVKWRWWFAEDLGATLFLIVGYIHVWRWLRWDDMETSNPNPRERRYWEKIVAFSVTSASLGFMTSIAFPTANAGLHTSLFLYRYQELNTDKNVMSNDMGEAGYRMLGGSAGCLLAVLYEWMVAYLDSVEPGNWADDVAHKMVYLMPTPAKKAVQKDRDAES